MGYNAAAVRASRRRKDTAAREAARNRNNQKAPFVEPFELIDGDYRIRMAPSHTEKNPLGYLDYRVHEIPKSYDDERPELIQCPRSNNWDPLPLRWVNEAGGEIPFTVDAEGNPIGYPVYKERCLCCELQDWINEEDEDGRVLYNELPENLQEIVSNMDHEVAGGRFGSCYVFPCVVKMEVNSKTKHVAESGKEYERVDYCPSDNLFHCVLKFKHNRKLTDDLLNILQMIPDLNDPTVGRWLTLKKINDGKGVGGYTLLYDPNPSSIDFEFDWKQHTKFPSWGKGSAKKPTKRFTLEQMIQKVEATDWGRDLRELYKVPLRDEDNILF